MSWTAKKLELTGGLEGGKVELSIDWSSAADLQEIFGFINGHLNGHRVPPAASAPRAAPPKDGLACPECGQKFGRTQALGRHRSVAHPSTWKPAAKTLASRKAPAKGGKARGRAQRPPVKAAVPTLEEAIALGSQDLINVTRMDPRDLQIRSAVLHLVRDLEREKKDPIKHLQSARHLARKFRSYRRSRQEDLARTALEQLSTVESATSPSRPSGSPEARSRSVPFTERTGAVLTPVEFSP